MVAGEYCTASNCQRCRSVLGGGKGQGGGKQLNLICRALLRTKGCCPGRHHLLAVQQQMPDTEYVCQMLTTSSIEVLSRTVHRLSEKVAIMSF